MARFVTAFAWGLHIEKNARKRGNTTSIAPGGYLRKSAETIALNGGGGHIAY
jgi:hypothetical protein